MKNKLVLLFILLCSSSFAQMDTYHYKRELYGIKDTWHSITLPDEMFGKISSDLSDIRIYGITKNTDTLEAPYILKIAEDESVIREIDFKIINKSRNKNGVYFTFEIPSKKTINSIKLNFKQQNFDYKCNLEGSHEQQKWFTISENYRIMAITNKLTDYSFTDITFPDSKYRYYRVTVLVDENAEKPELLSAKVKDCEIKKGHLKNFPVKSIEKTVNKEDKQSEIYIKLASPVPVSHLKIDVSDQFDYYRPLTIQYLVDSFKTEKGWKYNYRFLSRATLSSLEENEFKFRSKILQKLKIIINNYDNTPLQIGNVEVKGNIHQLIARFTRPANYYLTYGNPRAASPHYDIHKFVDQIPEEITELSVGEEQKIDKREIAEVEPLFKNKAWLWVVMILIISLLGWFSLKMIKQK